MAERRVSITERRSSFSERRQSADQTRESRPVTVRRASVGAGTVRTPLLRRASDASSAGADEEEEDEGAPSMLSYFVVGICMLGALSDGFVVGYSSPAAGALLKATSASGLLTHTQLFVFEALEPLGCIMGSFAAGIYADRFGRLRSLTITCAAFAIGWVLIATATRAGELFAGRIFTGIGVGMCVNLVPVYIAEVSPAGQRGAFASVVESGFLVGIAIMFALGLPALHLNWRDLALAALLPLALLAFAAETVLPESPRWLAMVGRPEEAVEALRRLRPRGYDVSKEVRRLHLPGSLGLIPWHARSIYADAVDQALASGVGDGAARRLR